MELFYLGLILALHLLAPSEGTSFEEDVTLSMDQKAALDKFKELFKNRLPHKYMSEDIYLVRWLKARNFNIQDAEMMLTNNLKWREENRMDDVINEDWSEFERDYRYFNDGKDKEGKPYLFFDVGTQDLRKIVVTGRRERYLRYVNKALEESFTAVRLMGEKYGNITRGNVIADLNGFNLVQHSCLQCIPMILNMILTYENHYPQTANKLILLNTPRIVEPLLNTLRGAVHPDTSKALKIYGTNRVEWKQALEKDFDFSELPSTIGGMKVYDLNEKDY